MQRPDDPHDDPARASRTSPPSAGGEVAGTATVSSPAKGPTPGGLRTRLLVGCVVLALGAAMFGRQTWHGWIPHDEGVLALSAERVLHGELPHRDFDEVYTGGLSFLHAGVFKVLGIHLAALRALLALCALAFLGGVYLLTLRVAAPVGAGCFALLVFAWSVPCYPASLPSWYNLFLATALTICLLRHLDTGAHRWLFAAGLAAGLSVLCKITGLFALGAALLWLAYRAASQPVAGGSTDIADPGDSRVDAPSAGTIPTGPGSARAWRLFLGGWLTLFLLGLGFLIHRHLGAMEILLYWAPAAMLCAVILHAAGRQPSAAFPACARPLLTQALVLLAGTSLPVVLFLTPYVLSASLGAVGHGVFVLPQRRLEQASYPLPPLGSVWAAIPLALLLLGPFAERLSAFLNPRRLTWIVGLGVLLVGLLILGDRQPIYTAVWHSLRPLVPIVCLGAALLIMRRATRDALSPRRRAEIFLLAAMAAMVSLVQFPYSFPIYFCYAAPLIALAALFVGACQPLPTRTVGVLVVLFFGLYAHQWLHPGHLRTLGVQYVRADDSAALDLPRGGLWVGIGSRTLYTDLCTEIQRHAAPGSFIYAAPDCPEVIFLAGMRNPTRTFYDFFDEPDRRVARILEALEAKKVPVVVLNRLPEFSPPVDPALVAALRARYPEHAVVHGRFEVRWREAR